MPVPRRGGVRWSLLAGTAAVSLAAGAAAPAVAEPTAPPVPAVAGKLPDRAGGPSQVHDVTLVTGDTVHVSVAADGTYSARADLAPRPDGRHVVTQTLAEPGHLYVLPSDATALVAAGRLDRRLFDVRLLVESGYTDQTSGAVPVIVRYDLPASPGRLSAQAAALPAGAPARTLESINGAALTVGRDEAAAFWASVAGQRPAGRASALGGGLASVWLDAKVQADLDESVPMIGAPQAWAGGHDGSDVKVAVLDTGVDTGHPDLAGRVVASRSFVSGESVQDGNGHGTHVASTIAGSGSASGGRYRGVSPGADLIVGKVLGDSGSGSSSAIIDGMEWATSQGAQVVSMSLGSDQPSDGTDPMSSAVDRLSASTGALFVVAAGNAGRNGPRTVAAPGAADAALTVGAVDKSDQLADFSSRGPRVTDYALKPDITAPGVDIVAARAEGTAAGPVVDESYTSISGTSMATPHVAGAAAILLQRHPDWSAEQVRAALTSTARDGGFTAYQQGAGRLDVATAYRAQVVAGTSKVDFGLLAFPQQGPPVTRTVTYRNLGGQPVTLDLSARLAHESGAAAPEGVLTVTPGSVEVPAGGTAEVTLTLDVTRGELGLYSGALLATADGVALRVPVGAYRQPEGHELTLRTATPPDAATGVLGSWVIRRVDTDGDWTFLPPSGATSVHLDNGVYNVSTSMAWADSRGDLDNYALLADPEVTIGEEDVSLTLDVADAERFEVLTPQRTESLGAALTMWRFPAGSTQAFGVASGQLPYRVTAWATPTEKVTVGRFFFEHTQLRGTPLVTARVAGHPALTLYPFYQHYSAKIPKLERSRRLTVVDVGKGTTQDFARTDVRGQVALIDIGDQDISSLLGTEFPRAELDSALRGGAVAALVATSEGEPRRGALPGLHRTFVLPTMVIPAEERAALLARMKRGRVNVDFTATAGISELYSLAYMEPGAIPASLTYRVDRTNLTTLRQNFHSARPSTQQEKWSARRPQVFEVDSLSAAVSDLQLFDNLGLPTRTEHVGPVSDGVNWYRDLYTYDLERFLAVDLSHDIGMHLGFAQSVDHFDRAEVRTETWEQEPSVPRALEFDPALGDAMQRGGGLCAACRYSGVFPGGDILPLFTFEADSDGHPGELTTWSNRSLDPQRPGLDEWHLYRDGAELPQQSLSGEPPTLPFYVLPAGPGEYRLTQRFEDWIGGFGSRTDTTWRFGSQPPTAKEVPTGYDSLGLCGTACRVEPLIFLDYDLNLRPDNTAPAPGVQVATVRAYHQASTGSMPRIAGLRLSASVDGGAHWYQVPAHPVGDGTYLTFMVLPPTHGTARAVSLRTEAWDSAGNRVEQIVHDAYGLGSRR